MRAIFLIMGVGSVLTSVTEPALQVRYVSVNNHAGREGDNEQTLRRPKAANYARCVSIEWSSLDAGSSAHIRNFCRLRPTIRCSKQLLLQTGPFRRNCTSCATANQSAPWAKALPGGRAGSAIQVEPAIAVPRKAGPHPVYC